jgi:guanylate kinase
VLTGPSGAGKDSILQAIKERTGFATPVNVTTRPRRPAEVEGVDYFFVSKPEFARLVSAGELLEHANVYGQDKGVPKTPIRKLLESGRDVILRTDIQGARYIESVVPGTLTIFVAPPSDDELERRLRERGGDTPEQVEVRLRTARQEMAAAKDFDYVVVNDDFDHCLDDIESIIAAEKARPDRPRLHIP